MSNTYCMFGFNKQGCLRAIARGYDKERINKFVKDEISKGNTCIVAKEEKWELVPKKYKEKMYWVVSNDPKDRERISKRLKN